ncbi:hypothetical protein EJ08DRAFT_252420 [Tothia fuscella]|uniref:Uncharacterized protein n=1 Tax=Tothia fuscella TaxID=1048955 RepID=A0A9P4NRU5_9PEZI|nr:hypothetical protein EJ08DRAFT_252420 [Tothia fuscella]
MCPMQYPDDPRRYCETRQQRIDHQNMMRQIGEDANNTDEDEVDVFDGLRPLIEATDDLDDFFNGLDRGVVIQEPVYVLNAAGEIVPEGADDSEDEADFTDAVDVPHHFPPHRGFMGWALRDEDADFGDVLGRFTIRDVLAHQQEDVGVTNGEGDGNSEEPEENGSNNTESDEEEDGDWTVRRTALPPVEEVAPIGEPTVAEFPDPLEEIYGPLDEERASAAAEDFYAPTAVRDDADLLFLFGPEFPDTGRRRLRRALMRSRLTELYVNESEPDRLIHELRALRASQVAGAAAATSDILSAEDDVPE